MPTSIYSPREERVKKRPAGLVRSANPRRCDLQSAERARRPPRGLGMGLIGSIGFVFSIRCLRWSPMNRIISGSVQLALRSSRWGASSLR